MEVTKDIDLRKQDLETLRAIFGRFPAIRSVRVFGSRATGTTRRASDIDIAVSAPQMKAREWSDMREALNTAPLMYGLDIIRLETLADKKLRARIAADGVVVYHG